MSDAAIPTPDSITAEFLTGVLRAGGHPAATVRNFTRDRIGTGQIGLCFRFALDLAEGDPTTPRSLVGKFPSEDLVSRQTGVLLKNYLKEVTFYRSLRSRLGISCPRCYYAEIVGEGPEFALLLEDMHPATAGNQLVGCSPTVARAAILELVGLHAPSWGDVSLRGLDWLGEPGAEASAATRDLYAAQLPGFVARYGSRLTAEEIRVIERVATSAGPPFTYPGEPFSLVHVDYRLDNLLIDVAGDPPRVSAVDWQSITLGSPLSDVAYFLGAGLQPAERRAVEHDIVRAYYGALVATGIREYPWEQCWTDYRRGVFAGLAVTVIASMLVQETARGNDMFTAMASRHSQHALDLGAEEFLG